MNPLAAVLVVASTSLHAVWNVIAKAHGSPAAFFARMLTALAVPALAIAVVAELLGPAVLPEVALLLMGAAVFQTIYWIGLTAGYRAGDLSVVYPLSRALPVIMLAVLDVARGRAPGPLGWVGLAMAVLGCFLVPASGTPDGAKTTERSSVAALIGIALASVGTFGYATMDKLAAEVLSASIGNGLRTAGHYAAWEFSLSAALFVPISRLLSFVRAGPAGREGAEVPDGAVALRAWPKAVVAAGLVFVAYGAVLWALQLEARASYVFALRLLSIVIGVGASRVLLRETVPGRRIGGVAAIVMGIALVSLRG